MTSPSVDASVQKLLRSNEFLEIAESGEGDNTRVRVKCQLTGHEMLPRVDVIETHLKSKKFTKARDWYCHDYSQYEPYIVPHRRLPKSLFCNVTGTILNRIPSEVEKHVQGKRYKRMKQHVKITVKKSDDDEDEQMQGNGEFDADAFEFENSQVIYSEGEEEEGEEEQLEGAKPKKSSKEEQEDDMADLYPDDESDEEMKDDEKKTKDEDGDEKMGEKFTKKRSAKGSSVPKKTRHKTKKTKKSE